MSAFVLKFPLTLILLPPSFTYKEPYDNIGSTQIIQDNPPPLKSLNFNYICKVPFVQTDNIFTGPRDWDRGYYPI